MVIVASNEDPELLCDPDPCAFRTIQELNAIY